MINWTMRPCQEESVVYLDHISLDLSYWQFCCWLVILVRNTKLLAATWLTLALIRHATLGVNWFYGWNSGRLGLNNVCLKLCLTGLYTSETMKNKRSLEAHKFFVSGWVQAVLHIKTDKCFVFKSSVKPSWRVTSKPHNTWVAVENSGKVRAAHCDCMAG